MHLDGRNTIHVMVLGASLLSVSCQAGNHDRCRCNALTCGCDCHAKIRASNGTCAPYRPTITDRTELVDIPVPAPTTVGLPPDYERFRASNRVPCKFGCGGQYLPGPGMAAHERNCAERPGLAKLDSAVRAHKTAVEKIRRARGPDRTVQRMTTEEREDALIFLEALVAERNGRGTAAVVARIDAIVAELQALRDLLAGRDYDRLA